MNVAINNRSGSPDPTRGSGPDKVTQAVEPDLDAPADAQTNEPSDSNMPDPARGGCTGFGWGCLPVIVGFGIILPAGLLF